MKVLTLFGTRPEVIKLAPVIQHLVVCEAGRFEVVTVTSAQHTDLLYPFIRLFGVKIDYDLQVMAPNQTPSQVCSRVLASLDPILVKETPDVLLVQGDTTTAMAGALAAFHRRIPVGHVEAGLRTADALSPYPEEMNRRLITRLASYHFAATGHNRTTLLSEGVSEDMIYVTGNPIVDSLKSIMGRRVTSGSVMEVLSLTRGLKRIVLTSHRRESFGEVMAGNLLALRDFVDRHEDVALIFPVHPNPAVRTPATALLSGRARIHLIEPLEYGDFIALLSQAWLIVSDSGGVQEEAPTLGKPLLVLRENTERPEAIESGVARLVGGRPEQLEAMLEQAYGRDEWTSQVSRIDNPFGNGDSGKRIAHILIHLSGREVASACTAEWS